MHYVAHRIFRPKLFVVRVLNCSMPHTSHHVRRKCVFPSQKSILKFFPRTFLSLCPCASFQDLKKYFSLFKILKVKDDQVSGIAPSQNMHDIGINDGIGIWVCCFLVVYIAIYAMRDLWDWNKPAKTLANGCWTLAISSGLCSHKKRGLWPLSLCVICNQLVWLQLDPLSLPYLVMLDSCNFRALKTVVVHKTG